MLLKQSTQRLKTILMVSATDHVTGLAGLTLTITASKDGAAFGAIAPTVADLGSGIYALTLTTSHTDTLGDLRLHITGGATADPADVAWQVVVDLPGAAMTLTSGERNSIADAHLDRANGIETGLTPRQAHRLEAAAAAGVLSGAETSTIVLRNAVADSKARVTATVDGKGNRTGIVTDLT